MKEDQERNEARVLAEIKAKQQADEEKERLKRETRTNGLMEATKYNREMADEKTRLKMKQREEALSLKQQYELDQLKLKEEEAIKKKIMLQKRNELKTYLDNQVTVRQQNRTSAMELSPEEKMLNKVIIHVTFVWF